MLVGYGLGKTTGIGVFVLVLLVESKVILAEELLLAQVARHGFGGLWRHFGLIDALGFDTIGELSGQLECFRVGGRGGRGRGGRLTRVVQTGEQVECGRRCSH